MRNKDRLKRSKTDTIPICFLKDAAKFCLVPLFCGMNYISELFLKRDSNSIISFRESDRQFVN